ncbi:MAG TPA: hypothetical protein P5181_07345 [Dermatophilaceae bacterium]|nr:hypothetical protein [Dermatophilaceae bacterium]
MYAALWRRLPGGRWARTGQCVLLAALAVVLLYGVVFPWLAPHLPIDDATLPQPSGATP